jgi:hypothetical protein
MFVLRRSLYWLAGVPLYWLSSLWLLFRVSPISVDNFGPSATFYWGKWGADYPTPTLIEYEQNLGARLPFLYPYWTAAFIITFVGCVLTPWLLRAWIPRQGKLFLKASIITLVILLLLGGLSDLGIAHHFWIGPLMYENFTYLWPFLKEIVPMSLCAGGLLVIRDRLIRDRSA